MVDDFHNCLIRLYESVYFDINAVNSIYTLILFLTLLFPSKVCQSLWNVFISRFIVETRKIKIHSTILWNSKGIQKMVPLIGVVGADLNM